MMLKKQVAKLESPKVSPFGGDLEGAGASQVFTIRKAVKEDCKEMLQLVKELAVYERAPDEVTITLEHFTDSGFGEKPVWWAFVATQKNQQSEKIVGFAMYYIRFSTWKGQRMYLEDFIVTEQARGKGIGKLLFDKLIETSKEEKFCGISWQVLHWNEPAINFYKRYYNATIEEGWLNCSYPLPLKGIKKKN